MRLGRPIMGKQAMTGEEGGEGSPGPGRPGGWKRGRDCSVENRGGEKGDIAL